MEHTMATATTTRIHEREPQIIVRDAAYAVTALADEAMASVRTLSAKAEKLRDEAPAKAKELRETAPTRFKSFPEGAQTTLEERRAKVETQLKDLRGRASKDADARLVKFEASFDAKAAAGAVKVATLRQNDHLVKMTSAFEPVGDQLKVARTQVKGAVTSMRKTVEAAVDAGKTQAGNAKTQVKGAVTSSRKTVDAVVEAGRELAS
jgi:F0F1-type ATP synthase membrane subunit b/b'